MSQPVELKLKQASAVLGVAPKDLQNLVQFKVLRPRREDSVYWFNDRMLLTAKVAFYLKESLGTSTELLARFTEALSGNLKKDERTTPRYVWLSSRPTAGREPVEVRIPLANLAKELKEQLPRAAECQDLPRGRKRAGWKREFTRKLETAARDLSGVTESQIAQAIRAYRTEKKRLPEITVGRSQRSS
jgi:plasmid maintenance system antidote protein VapI